MRRRAARWWRRDRSGTAGGGARRRGGASQASRGWRSRRSRGGAVAGGAAGGGAGAGGCGVAREDVAAVAQPSPEQKAATAFARAVVASPCKSSHRWASSFGGGVDLDDDIWEIRFHFSGEDNLERTISRSDITVLNLLALVEQRGYGIRDYMYYVKERGKGKEGMEVVDSMAKVDEMLELYDSENVLNITVVKDKAEWPIGLNREDVEATNVVDVPVVLSDNKSGVNFMANEVEEVYPVAIDYSDVVYIGTQHSSTMNKGKGKLVAESDEDEDLEDRYDSDKEINDNEVGEYEAEYMYYDGEYRPELAAAEREAAIEADLELMREFRKKRHAAQNAENEEIMDKLQKMKEQKADPFLHFEGDTDVEEIFEAEEDSEVEEIIEKIIPLKNKAAKCGPTSSSHHEVVKFEEGNYFMPTSDEESSPDEVADSDDDGFVSKFVPASGRKRRLKKMKKRVWYDETRANPHEQIGMKLCFTDVYQFRRALRTYHIAQLRNFQYWRNDSDRIIVFCPREDDGCPFYISASKIAHEKTFCIRKILGVHTCIADGQHTKVTIDWLAKQSEQAVRIDPNTTVDTLIDNAKQKWGVPVPRSKAYRARKKAFAVVMGDQKAQYTRLRDYLQAVLDTNPGSRCIVTTKHLVEYPSTNPRGPELKKHMDAASYCYTKPEFDRAMDAMKADCEEAYNWLMQIPVETWARHAFDTNCKTDLVVNNISEVFNKMILDVRNKPIRTMLEGLRNKVMVKNSGTREKTERTRWEITPHYTEKLEEAKRWSRECTAKNCDVDLWQVSNSRRNCAVNLKNHTCSCRKWDITGVPCSHAVAAIMKVRQHPEDYVHEFFKKPLYKEAYKHVVYPVPGPDDWKKTETDDIDPPVFREKPGRKQVKRRKGQFEVPAPRDTSRMASITCSNCKVVGHRYTSCQAPLKPQLQVRKNKHQSTRQSDEAPPPAPPAAPAPPTARAAPEAPIGRATPAAPRGRAAPAAPRGRAAPAATRGRAPPPAPRFSAPRTSTAPAPDVPRRVSGRKRLLTGRMKGYLTAGKFTYRQDPPAPAPDA
ncbi:hypothetical protein QYE76_064777 [Lolium multiflorum]|uniref:SWIM-type domain-containing protein n=1 Tax=Lolium multiflorum TaxID=4521 RepID=A0AAD8S7M3_LOLMU|nr:hypothetical protein QYE76_064777 [Lolium multiflorum]